MARLILSSSEKPGILNIYDFCNSQELSVIMKGINKQAIDSKSTGPDYWREYHGYGDVHGGAKSIYNSIGPAQLKWQWADEEWLKEKNLI